MNETNPIFVIAMKDAHKKSSFCEVEGDEEMASMRFLMQIELISFMAFEANMSNNCIKRDF